MIGKPSLKHEEIKQLYQYGHEISKSTVESILALPRETLIDDLEEVLREAAENFSTYNEAALNGSKEHLFYAPLHTFLMLGELASENSLPIFEQFLRQDTDVLGFWFGDALTELLGQCVYNISKQDITKVIPFIQEPVRDIFAKSAHQDALVKYLLLQQASPIRTGVIEQTKKLVHELVAQAKKSDEWTDENDTLSLFVLGLAMEGIVELSAEIKMVVKADLMMEYEPSDWSEVQAMLSETPEIPTINTIHEQYAELKAWDESVGISGDSSDFDEYKAEEDELYEHFLKEMEREEKLEGNTIYSSSTPFKHETPKVGRNEPCPCGSGKKYKKCCLKK